MKDKIDALRHEATRLLGACPSLKSLEELRVRFLGRKEATGRKRGGSSLRRIRKKLKNSCAFAVSTPSFSAASGPEPVGDREGDPE